jgi:streptogramin lyase
MRVRRRKLEILVCAIMLAMVEPPSTASAATVTEFPITTADSTPCGITGGPDGNLWFTEQSGNRIGRITPAGVITEFPLPAAGSFPEAITAGSDGNLWFTQVGFLAAATARITLDGVVTGFPVFPPFTFQRRFITAGPDGALWFTEDGRPARTGSGESRRMGRSPGFSFPRERSWC